ncbi:hypothetical protein CAPTEDRAFT_210588 [Capitella teleta]|uniref:C-type lectin domain-containing protein n=1 Tax=Capitella teleta TaxID=283909 RepID=R7U9D1_CAPTE|nr:hypothetical protein CAPTEDRAFT_210588 [Capitella teleta]|eukprot:ELT99745.1 hypothetical protein CAPTEDRAFT_210588 [Capitella teleta]
MGKEPGCVALLILLITVVLDEVLAAEQELGEFKVFPGMAFKYTFMSSEVTYADAEQNCVDTGQGHLTSILSTEELAFLTEVIKQVEDVPASVWIGLQSGPSGDLEWADGSMVNFTSGLSRAASQICYSWDLRALVWEAVDCSASKKSICKQFSHYETSYNFGDRGDGLLLFDGSYKNRSDAYDRCTGTTWEEVDNAKKLGTDSKYSMSLVSVANQEEAEVIRQAFFHLPEAQQHAHRRQWIGLYQDSTYFEHNGWQDGLLSRYRPPGAKFVDLFARCVHWDLLTNEWSDEVGCYEEISFMCMKPALIPRIDDPIDPVEAPGAKTIGMVFLLIMASFIGLLMLCDIPTLVIRGRKICCRNLTHPCRKTKDYKKVHAVTPPGPSEVD